MRLRNSNGFSLIELVVATAILAGLILLIMNFLVGRIVENAVANARSELQFDTQLTLDLLNRDLKHAANVDLNNRWPDSYSPGSPANDFSWQSDADTLVIAQPVQDGSGNIVYEDPQVYVSFKNNLIYFLDGTTLYRRTLAAPVVGNSETTTCPPETTGCSADSKLAANISALTLNYYDAYDNEVAPSDARSVRITLHLSRLIFGRQLEVEQSIRTVFRNE